MRVVRVFHLGRYAAQARARNDRVLLTVVWRLGSTMLPVAALLLSRRFGFFWTSHVRLARAGR